MFDTFKYIHCIVIVNNKYGTYNQTIYYNYSKTSKKKYAFTYIVRLQTRTHNVGFKVRKYAFTYSTWFQRQNRVCKIFSLFSQKKKKIHYDQILLFVYFINYLLFVFMIRYDDNMAVLFCSELDLLPRVQLIDRILMGQREECITKTGFDLAFGDNICISINYICKYVVIYYSVINCPLPATCLKTNILCLSSKKKKILCLYTLMLASALALSLFPEVIVYV